MKEKNTKVGAFTVKVDDLGNVNIASVSGFSIRYTAGSSVAMHIISFIDENDNDSLHALITLYYSIVNIVFDEKLYVDIIESLNRYIERNKKPLLSDHEDNDIIENMKEEAERFEEAFIDNKNEE